MAKPVRLTDPQLFVLADCARGPVYLAESYPPRRRLLEFGLIEATRGGRYTATEAGRSALSLARGQTPGDTSNG